MRFVGILVMLLLASGAQAQTYKVGDWVVVKDDVKLQNEGKIVDELPPGLVLRVAGFKEDKLYVGRGKPGWLRREHVLPHEEGVEHIVRMFEKHPKETKWQCAFARAWDGDPEEAIAIMDEVISEEPNVAAHRALRGNIRWNMGNDDKTLDNALSDYNESIRMKPNQPRVYFERGNIWLFYRNRQQSLDNFNNAIRFDPNFGPPYCWRGRVYHGDPSYDKAISDYRKSIECDPINPNSYNLLAWLLATCDIAKYRDGEKAIMHANKACELTDWRSSGYLETLAAAYAEYGDFENAVKWQKKAIELAGENPQEDLNSRLHVYKKGKPYRDVIALSPFSALAEDQITAAIERLGKNHAKPDRIAAAQWLRKSEDRHALQATDSLTAMCKDADADIRYASVLTLDTLCRRYARPCPLVLVEAMYDPVYKIRTNAGLIVSLYKQLPHEAVPLLLQHAAHTDVEIRANTLNALGRAGADDALALAVLRQAVHDRDVPVRTNAVAGLWHATDDLSQVVPHWLLFIEEALLAETRSNDDAARKDVATLEMAAIGADTQLQKHGRRRPAELCNVLVELLRSDRPVMQRAATKKLAAMSDYSAESKQVVASALQDLLDDPNEDVRSLSAATLKIIEREKNTATPQNTPAQ